MDKFVKGARIRQVAKALEKIPEQPLSLGECIYATLDVRYRHYPELSKVDFLRLLDTGWDAYLQAVKETM